MYRISCLFKVLNQFVFNGVQKCKPDCCQDDYNQERNQNPSVCRKARIIILSNATQIILDPCKRRFVTVAYATHCIDDSIRRYLGQKSGLVSQGSHVNGWSLEPSSLKFELTMSINRLCMYMIILCCKNSNSYAFINTWSVKFKNPSQHNISGSIHMQSMSDRHRNPSNFLHWFQSSNCI